MRRYQTHILFLFLFFTDSGGLRLGDVQPDLYPEEPREPRCASFVIWEVTPRPELHYAVDRACNDHQLATGQATESIETVMFARCPTVWVRPGAELVELTQSGTTVRIALGIVDKETVYFAVRRLH